MSLLSTFCTNSINILAGINGSEVSQAVVISLSIVLNDLLFLPWPFGFRIALPLHVTDGLKVGGVWSAGMAYGSRILVERHLFSLYFMLPLLGVCLGFMYHNWYVHSSWGRVDRVRTVVRESLRSCCGRTMNGVIVIVGHILRLIRRQAGCGAVGLRSSSLRRASLLRPAVHSVLARRDN